MCTYILAGYVTLSINQLKKLVSSPAALLARAPRRRRLIRIDESTLGQHRLQKVVHQATDVIAYFNLILPCHLFEVAYSPV